MKRFGYKLLTFSLFFILFLGVNTLINYAFFQNSSIPVLDPKIIISGDSHPQRSLNPDRLHSAVNISQNGEPYVLTYWKLRYIFQHHKPAILVLGFSPHNISAFNDRKFWDQKWSSEMFKRSYMIGDFGSLKNIKIDYNEYYKSYFRQMCLYPHTRHFNFIGTYDNSYTSDLSGVDKAIRRHFYYDNKELGVSETAIEYLDLIIRLCEENHVVPVLVGSPVHETYFRLIPTTIKDRYHHEVDRLKKRRILVLDFTEAYLEDSFFLNVDHLNEKGASHFTDKIFLLLKDMKVSREGEVVSFLAPHN